MRRCEVLKVCDLTQFYSPVSGGVKRYLHEKIRFIQSSPNDEHVLIVPGAKTERTMAPRSRIYSIRSPLVSRTSRYRVLLNLRAIDEILEREQPDLIESADPYQVGWRAVGCGRRLRVPVVGFYHSHFPEAHLRGSERLLGRAGSERLMGWARSYVRKLYNQFEATLVPSPRLAQLLASWGVKNVRSVDLGMDAKIFQPQPNDRAETRNSLGISTGCLLLLYVGRLAQEKNTQTLFAAFAELVRQEPDRYHLLVVGDGAQRAQLQRLQQTTGHVSWQPYCAEAPELARLYRAADLLVHPGVQETFGLTALEAQACGTPVVGIRGSYMDRIIFAGQNFWAEENSPAAFAQAIAAMSKADLRALGAAAAARALEEFAWPGVFRRLFCIYDEVRAKYRDR